LLPFNLGLLYGQLPLYFLFLILPRLHLVADQGPADQPHGRADTGSRSGVSRSAADNRSKTRAGECANGSTLFSRGQWFGATEQS
jgi:hypothetical protein